MPKYNVLDANIRPFDFQLAALNKISKFISLSSDDSFLLNFPMGAGKSHLISLISHLESGSALIITPSVEIKFQILEQCKRFKSEYKLSEKELLTLDDKNLNVRNDNIIFATFQGLFSLYQSDREKYLTIQRSIRFLLIDEGHREPSSQWAYVVRKIKKPKILFTATPYRNDFNIFEIKDKNVEIQTYEELKDYKTQNGSYILREVQFCNDEGWQANDAEDFLKIFFKKFTEVCNKPYLKSIIRCKDSSSIEELVSLINKAMPGLAVGVHTGYDKSLNKFGLFENYSDIPQEVINKARIYIHQFKLIEGVDDKNFIFLALFNPFISARALIQQVGRILRFKEKRRAVVLENSDGKATKMWNDYIEFDKKLSVEKKLWGIQKFSNEYAKHINKILYENSEFKTLLEIENLGPEVIRSLKFSRRVYIYQCADKFNLTDAIDLLESDFSDTYRLIKLNSNQIKKNLTRPGIIRNSFLFLYVEVQNSKVLDDTFFPEITINAAGFFQIGQTLFFYNSGRGRPKTLLESGLILPFSNSELEVLYGSNPVFSNLSLSNLDISDSALRQRTVRAANLNETMTSNLDYSFYVNNSVFKDNDSSKYLGFSSSRFSDLYSKDTTLNGFVSWISEIEGKLENRVRKNKFLKRFAQTVDAIKQPVPNNILLDVFQSESYLREEFSNDVMSLLRDTTEKSYRIETVNKGSKIKYIIQFKLKDEEFPLELYQKKHRFYLRLDVDEEEDIDELDKEIKLERKILRVLIREINRKNLFRLTFENSRVVYASGKYFQANNLEVLSEIVFPDPNLTIQLTEKGESLLRRKNTTSWCDSIFKYISDYNPQRQTTILHKEMGHLDYLFCDDGSNEIADFILLQNNRGVKKIVFVVCKSKVGSNDSVTSLYDVSAQALKNLNYLNPLSGLGKLKADRFSGSRTLSTKNGSYNIERLKAYNGNSTEPQTVFNLYENLLRDPNTIKEVWLVIGGGLVGDTFKQELKVLNDAQAYYIIQAQYLLLSTWASVSSANVRLKVFC